MHKSGGPRRLARACGVIVVFAALFLGSGAVAVGADGTATATTPTATTPPPDSSTVPADQGSLPQSTVLTTSAVAPPYGSSYPVTLETNFSRPYKAISTQANSDFSLLNDLERLIRGSYRNQNTGQLRSDRTSNYVYLSISRMENSHRVGRELVKAAKAGVKVRVIHGKASQSNESRALQSALNDSSLRDAHFKICVKGKSLACLSSLNGAIMHSKILMVNHTYDRDGNNAIAAIWSGSANLGGPSGEQTYNNGLTIYNDKKLWEQSKDMWSDMYNERYVNNDYLTYIANNAGSGRYGYSESEAQADGYTHGYATRGMFYSNLANVTIYATPIRASPSNGKDPVIMLLNRVIPDDQCRIRLQENRFKYRRIAVAQKLVQLANAGCKVSAVSFEDDLLVNRIKHCQQYIRICRPILDVFKTANQRIETAWAKPHDKTILIEARLRPNRLNSQERLPTGEVWPTEGAAVKLVQAGSAALTGSNLVVSDEITTETTDPSVYDDYLQHWKAIWKSHEIHSYPY